MAFGAVSLSEFLCPKCEIVLIRDNSEKTFYSLVDVCRSTLNPVIALVDIFKCWYESELLVSASDEFFVNFQRSPMR